MLYLPKPSHSEPLCLDSASQQRPHSMHARQQACFEHGECDKADGLALAACSSISIRGQWSFHLIIQFCISKPCLLNCNEVAHAPAMACHVCASVLAKSIRLGGYTGKYEQLQTTIVYICAIIYQYVQICNKKYVSVHTTTYTTYMHISVYFGHVFCIFLVRIMVCFGMY